MTWAFISIAVVLAGTALVLVLLLRTSRLNLHSERQRAGRQDRRIRELEHRNARNAAILENAMDGFFVLGQDYRFLEVNEAFRRMTGYSPEELLRMKMTDLEVAGGEGDASDAGQWRTGLHHFATAHRHKDGHVIQLESCVVVLRDEDQKLLVGFARDVTGRWRSEQALRKSEAQYRNLVETSRDLIWSLDLEGRWTFVNNAARAIYGYEPEEMLGRPIGEFIGPRGREGLRAFLAGVRAGKPRLHYEAEHQRKDGRPVRLIVNAIPLRDDYGNVIGCTGTASDITERKEAERRLREAHDRFESLVTGMPLGYIVWSRDLEILEWNPGAEAIFGYSLEDARGRRLVDLIVPSAGTKAFNEMSRALLESAPGSNNANFVNRRRDGEKIKCEWYNTVLPDASGQMQAVATIVSDVSERERLEAQLRQSQRLESLGVLAGGVAHDFNNLLVGIMGNASLAFDQMEPKDPLRNLVEKVINAGRRATQLTQRMLAYAGRAVFDVQIMDLNELVEEMADFATAAVSKAVALKIDVADNLPLIKADASQLQQVIMNLLINAAEAIGDGSGEVVVSTRCEELDAERLVSEFPDEKLTPGRYVCLEVRDSGCGMSAETLSRIFDPFFSTKFAGRGLGLSAILGIVKAHRGAIFVSSEEDSGTTFRVYFPIAARRPTQTESSDGPVEIPTDTTILVIDDEEDIRDVVQAVLGSRGVHVLCAEDGASGLEIFKQRAADIDAVLLDLNMPGMSGESVFEAMRSAKSDVRVILSTGYSEQEAASHFSNAQLAGFVHKPYTATALIEKVGAALGTS